MTLRSPSLRDHLPLRLPFSGFCRGFVSSFLIAWSMLRFVFVSSLRKPFSKVRVVRSLYFSSLLQLREEFVVVSYFLGFDVFVGLFYGFHGFRGFQDFFGFTLLPL